MLRSLKHWLRDRVPYSLLLPFYYWRFQRRYVPLYEQACRRAGFRRLQDLDLSSVKRSDTLFVLGSGASINQISAECWTTIAAHDSVGFNFWPLHPFVPTMYFFESNPADLNPEHDRLMRKILTERALEYEHTLKVVMDITNPGHQYIFDLPEKVRRSIYSVETVPLIARNRQELARGIRHLIDEGEFAPSHRIARLVKVTGTLTTLITLGVRMGYRTIVLCGIDLTRAEYFYQDRVLYPETADFQYMPRAGKHLTMTQYAWGVMPIDDVLMEVKRQVLEPAGIELYVQNPSSALYPRIPQTPASLLPPQVAEKAPQ